MKCSICTEYIQYIKYLIIIHFDLIFKIYLFITYPIERSWLRRLSGQHWELIAIGKFHSAISYTTLFYFVV